MKKGTSWFSIIAPPLALVAIAAALSAWIIDSPLFLDDYTLLNKAGQAQNRLGWTLVNLYNFTHKPPPSNNWLAWWSAPTVSLHYIRPLSSLLFWLEYRAFGWNATGYHLLNLVFYLLNGLLLYRLALTVSGSRLGAFVAGAAFLAHPAHLTNVQWVANRPDLVCGAFLLAGLTSVSHAMTGRVPRYRTLAPPLLLLILATLSKEAGMLGAVGYLLWLWAAAPESGRRRRWGLILVLASILTAAGFWFCFRSLGGGVTSEYYLPAISSGWELAKTMGTGFLLSMGSLLFFMTANESQKASLFTDHLWPVIGFIAAGLLLVCAAIWLLRRDRFALAAVIIFGVWMGPSLMFWTGERLLLIPSLMLAFISGQLAVRISRWQPSWPAASGAVLGLFLVWQIAAPQTVLMLRLSEREEQISQTHELLIEQLRAVLDKSQPPEAMFFLTLPSGLSLLSLTDVLRTELNMPELRTYSLGAFAASPSLAINREDQMTLIAPQGQPFFATREERIFLTGEESVHPLRLFRSADFTARITDMPHKYPLSMQFTFKRPMTDHAYAFFMVDQHGILLRIKPRPFGRQPPATQPGTPFVVP